MTNISPILNFHISENNLPNGYKELPRYSSDMDYLYSKIHSRIFDSLCIDINAKQYLNIIDLLYQRANIVWLT